MQNDICTWKYDDYTCHYEAECGYAFTFIDGILTDDSDFRFCPKCGKKINAEGGEA